MPMTAAPSQCVARASQNATCPFVTGENCPVTVAVRVTVIPAVTLLDDTLNVVVVGLPLPCASGGGPKTNGREINIAARVLVLTISVHTCSKQSSTGIFKNVRILRRMVPIAVRSKSAATLHP